MAVVPVTIFLTIAVGILLAAILLAAMKRPPKYPPGPLRWPLVGNIFSLSFRQPFSQQFMAMAEKYGKVFGIKMGEFDAVVLTDLEDMRKVLTLEEATGRWRFFQWTHLYFNQNVGLLFSDGPVWKTTRRFCLRTMKDFGFGNSSMEALIEDEARELVDQLAKGVRGKEDGFEADLGRLFVVTVINSLWVMIANERVGKEDMEFKKVFQSIPVSFDNLTLCSMMPTLIPLLPKTLSGIKKHDEMREVLFGFLQKVVDRHKATLDTESPRDLTDKFLIEQKKSTGEGHHIFTDMNLKAVLLDLLEAGSETTSTALSWIFLYLVRLPDFQERIFREVMSVVGPDRTPNWDDSGRMHFTQAFIHEIWRYVSVAPLGLDHRLLKDVQLGEYLLPKGTIVISILHAVHMSTNYWQEPEKFNPDRFLDSEGRFAKNPAMVAFGIGKRQCLGESLARMTTFLVVAHLVQSFSFHKVPGFNYQLKPKPYSQIIHLAFPYKVRVISRKLTEEHTKDA